MSCKSPRDEIGHKTTLAILNKLSNYEWNAKAVLTMAAFALEYSEFWMHASSVPTILLQNLEQYKIVWIPIVEEWTVEYDNKFEDFKCKMPWFAVQHSRTIASLYMVVVLSPQGKVQHSNAFHLIQAHGKRAFPFTFVKQEQINNEIYWVGSEIGNIYPIINTWFTKNVSILASDAAITEANISIEWLCVEKEDKSVMRRFWGGIESLFVTKVHKAVDAVTQEVQKMLSFKNESGWDGSPY
ncbi:hypothetical protein JHK82_056979 [Glycine max]|nr:hypothetical protein JHK86_056813 [Glycine max]KAG4919550.1 hypothetical protein JHK85_057831 [Glycine max]KAG5078284.1 hypothetical protein JHK82_056979 [Glycine max]